MFVLSNTGVNWYTKTSSYLAISKVTPAISDFHIYVPDFHRNATNGEITVKEIPTEFSDHVIDAFCDQENSRCTSPCDDGSHHCIPKSIGYCFIRTICSYVTLFVVKLNSNPLHQTHIYVRFMKQLDESHFGMIIANSLPRSAVQRAKLLKEQLSVALERTDRLEQLALAGNDQFVHLPNLSFPKRDMCCSRSGWSDVNRFATDKSSRFMQFFGRLASSLCGVDISKLQSSVMNYLYEQTCSETGFLIMKVPDTTEYVCYVSHHFC
ncbi:hypothetical protein PHET_01757 [Paragonimus heterotremus]|uniref:Uncharacterized protein n=1 Tax=Paragonimus heterotremus TaxID=100268 RepID=A0A8J4TM13_9TREM|nr:hypothetical protein PHET_01757 [Paragonimus heterotremus]